MLLLGFAFIFYNTIQQGSTVKLQEQIAEARSLRISEEALLLPELSCSNAGIVELNCLDMLKSPGFITLVKSGLDEKAEYFTIFESSEVVVHQVWPVKQTIVLYNNTPAHYRSKTTFSAPLLLKYPLQNKNAFGVMDVTTYAET